ncbi:MAG: SDR family oxidoreductase [Acidobacteriia bacterium]|nr:SDR family oxidoreductase [Terriglobia bacterium]
MAIYLVTGGAGFIGSNLAESILSAGDDVRVLDDFSTGRRENLRDAEAWARAGGGRFELIEGDVRDPATCREAVAGAEFVLHEAAIPSIQRSVRDPVATNAVNVAGTLNLLVAARDAGVARFVFASSSSLYGESEVLPKVESMPTAPISPYGLQKLAGESYTRLFHALYRLPAIALRYFNVFGPRQDPKSEYAAVVPRFVTAAKTGEEAVVYGDGEQSRDFTFVSNVVEANLLACRAGADALGKAFNVACGERISLNGLLGVLGELAGRPVRARHDPERPGDIKHSLAGIDLAARHLGYRPRVTFREGIERTWGSL